MPQVSCNQCYTEHEVPFEIIDEWQCQKCGVWQHSIIPNSVPQEMFLTTQADIAIFGGAAGGGKTFALLMDAMRYCIPPESKQFYRALLLRKTFSQINQGGGLADASERLYNRLGAKYNVTKSMWKFDCGAEVRFGHLEHTSDKIQYQGAELAWIGFDELTHFEEEAFWYLMSRNRSTAGVRPVMRASCNPDASSWVARMIEWWIDQDTGYAIDERSGKVRWFVRPDNQLVFADTKEELVELFPDLGPYAKSLTFIPSKLNDNVTLRHKNPEYLSTLLQMPKKEREQLLSGNWLVNPTEGSEWEDCPHYFDRHIWCDAWPDQFIASAMTIDPSKGRSENSDYSAIVFCGLKGGKVWVKSDIRKNRPPEQIVRDAINMYLELRPTLFGMESNAFQDLFLPIFNHECELRNIPGIPMHFYYNSVNKQVRIRSLGPHLEAQRFLLHKNCEGNRVLYGQLKDFGIKGIHDDGPDALEQCLRLLYEFGVDVTEDESHSVPENDGPEFEYALV